MSSGSFVSVTAPAITAVLSLALGWAATAIPVEPTWVPITVGVLAAGLFVVTVLLARRAFLRNSVEARGGSASVYGDESEAYGGAGGKKGGRGGSATVKGNRSVARGGKGGDGD